ncbi:MAG: hypothetical protein K9N07_00160 [Candidatus Cloacimonetes bacterium]|nr:hypothetical protein [Candidatus Cloacimonadota bacterium]
MIKKLGIPVLKAVKDKFGLKTESISKKGKLVFENQITLRRFAQQLNVGKDIILNKAKTAHPGELNAVDVISTIIQKVISAYVKKKNPSAFEKSHNFLNEKIGNLKLDRLKKDYQHSFYSYPKADFIRETLLIWILNKNEALEKYKELFDDKTLKTESDYPIQFELLQVFFKKQPGVDSKDKDLFSFLLEPFIKYPNSIFDQLNFIKNNWQELIEEDLELLLQGIDLLKEENKADFFGPGPTYLHEFHDEEYEKFTEDKDWMPHLILIAKSVYVWLEQLSRKYKLEVKKLDQIPEEELQLQASRGITGIWLIGIWQRSSASKRIKELNGDYEAIASAYSLDDYRIADDLGGESSLEELKKKCRKFGMRLGCDMVPNHTGIDSDWIVKHPQWFIQIEHTPFPAYSFSGENLSKKSEIQVRIEDHYYEKSDAAVVFQYIKDGITRYIYHGNDGTSTPWNDTAQLNYLMPEVRQAVKNKIIEIAKEFSIIRFDAAMTLAKKHIQRLWYPEPGSGGDIATRSEFGLSKTEFNRLFPNEFWRDVVDSVAQEAPDTLLLAEAFWMMEGYFVRTLGIHRVYNSAFMNMLKNEENAKYRKSIFNILEFNPQILKRFVNFMSNPDEETAIDQFGKDDKYFGVCLLMSTLPGLPMFAHGQVEGFTEKYGMEFHKAKWQENEDEYLIERHNREIFPLLNKRYLFSEVENFVLFDFITENNELNEDVFVYANNFKGQHSLVIYNNKYQHTTGWINWADLPIEKDGDTIWTKKNLASVWNLHNDKDYFVIFKEEISGKTLIRNCREIHQRGLFQELGAFKYAVLLDIYEVKDNEKQDYSKLAEYLQGGGVDNIYISLKRTGVLPILEKFNEFINWDILTYLIILKDKKKIKTFKAELISRINEFLEFMQQWLNSQAKITTITADISIDLDHYFKISSKLNEDKKLMVIMWILLRHLGKLTAKKNYETISTEFIDEFFLGDELQKISKLKFDADLLKISIKYQNLWKFENSPEQMLNDLLQINEAKRFLAINQFENKLWYNKERFEMLSEILEQINLISIRNKISRRKPLLKFIKKLKLAGKTSEFQVEKLLAAFREAKGEKRNH